MTPRIRVAVIALAVLTGVGACDPGQQTPTRETCELPSVIVSGQASAAAAPAGGGLRVVEKGFTQAGDTASAGAILENTSAMVAYRTRIVLRLLDSSGNDATAPGSAQLVQEIPIVLPGQRVGAGSFSFLKQVTVNAFEVDMLHTSWVPRSQLAGFGGTSGAYTQIRRLDPADLEGAYLDYTVTVSSCRALHPRMVAAVYRDRRGAIIGGTLETSAGRGELVCQQGTHPDWLSARGLPAPVDPPRTEFYPYCDLAAKPAAPTTPEPWN